VPGKPPQSSSATSTGGPVEILVRDERLPLPRDVRVAIADDCRDAQRRTSSSGCCHANPRPLRGPVSSSTVAHVTVRARLEPASGYQLRHAAATAMRRAGVPPSGISHLLCHQHWHGIPLRAIDLDELGSATPAWRRPPHDRTPRPGSRLSCPAAGGGLQDGEVWGRRWTASLATSRAPG
jgi:hypothetical protein